MRCLLFLLSTSLLLPLLNAQPSSTLNVSQDLVAWGIAGANMTPNTPALDSRPLFEAALAYAKTHPLVTRIVANPGAYYFNSLNESLNDRHVLIADMSNLTIDLQGSDLYFFRSHRFGFGIERCSNMTFENFTMDYTQLPFTQVTVTAVNTNHRTFEYSVNTGFDNPSVFNSVRSVYDPAEPVHVFFFRQGRPLTTTSRFTVQRPFAGTTIALTGGQIWEAAGSSRIRPGDVAVITPRGSGEPIQASLGTHLTFKNIRIYSSGINGLATSGVKNLSIERVYVMPRPGTDRLISSNADGISLQRIRENTTVRLSRSIRTLDDGIAAAALNLGTVAGGSGRQLYVTRQFGNFIPNGVTLMFQDRITGAILGNAAVVSQAPLSDGSTFFDTFQLEVDSDLPSPLPWGTAVYSTDQSSRGHNLLLERNTVQEQVFARGISLWGLVNSTVRGNYLRNTQMAGIFGTHRLMSLDWMSPPLQNVDIQRNVIDGAATIFGTGVLEKMGGIQILAQKQDFQPMTISPHNDVRITDNFIARPSRSAIRVENVTNGSVSGNILLNPNNNPYVEGYWEDTFEPYITEFKQPIVVKSSTGVTPANNTVEQSANPIHVTDSSYRQLTAFAPGARVYLNANGIGSLSSPSITLRDANGTIHATSVVASSAHLLDVAIPANAALGGAFFTVTSAGAVLRGTLFVDSHDSFPAVNGCLSQVSPLSATAPAAGGTVSVRITIPANCTFSSSTAEEFLSITGGSGSGPSTVSIQVSPNLEYAREGVVFVSGIPVRISQPAPTCSYTFDPLSITAPQQASSQQVTVISQPGCFTNIASDSSFLTITSIVGAAPATVVTFNVSSNPGASRTGSLSVGGASFPVHQNGSDGLHFIPVTPCRIADTRNPNGTFGGPMLAQASTRNFPIPQSACGIPTTARAYSLNVTVVPSGTLGYLTMWPFGGTQPVVSTLNALDGQVTANAAIVPAGINGAVSVFVPNPTHVIIDINGYFDQPQTAGLAFYPVTPCRVADTRSANGPFGGPSLQGGAARTVNIPAGTCGIPASAKAYALNLTAIPSGVLGYITTWPTGQPQPVVSTTNSLDGQVTANMAIVPAGANGSVNFFATHATNLIVDINGYFGLPGSPGELRFFPSVAPCRVGDTRNPNGGNGGPILAAGGVRPFLFNDPPCALPLTAKAFSLNATAAPSGFLGYLTIWPADSPQPLVSTLNAYDGQVTANAAIVPAGPFGTVSVFAPNPTHVILDVNGFFAP